MKPSIVVAAVGIAWAASLPALGANDVVEVPTAEADPAAVADPGARPGSADGESTPVTEVGGETRYIGQAKSFLPMSFPSPIIATQISLVEAVAYMTTEGVDVMELMWTGDEETYTAELVGFGQELALGIGIRDRFGIEIAGRAMVVTGVDDTSAISIGGLARADLDGLLKLQVLERPGDPGLKLTIGLRGGYGTMKQVMPAHVLAGFIDEVMEQLEDEYLDPEDALNDSRKHLLIHHNDLSVGPALMFGVGASRFFSALLYADARYVHTTMESSLIGELEGMDIASTLGLALTLDLGPVFPLALQFEYSTELLWYGEFDGEEQGMSAPTSHNLGGGIYYSALTDLQLGVAGHGLIDTEKNNTEVQASFCFRYFF